MACSDAGHFLDLRVRHPAIDVVPAARRRLDQEGAGAIAQKGFLDRNRQLRYRLFERVIPPGFFDRHTQDGPPTFLTNVETEPDTVAIPRAIIAMARHFGLRVVAEGVATREQFDFLRACGCHCYQGIWISEALPADAFAEFCWTRP
jgi:EAL domain